MTDKLTIGQLAAAAVNVETIRYYQRRGLLDELESHWADIAGTPSQRQADKVTIKHGPLANLDMPAMTMAFRMQDPAMLNHVKEGDKIKFVAERVNGTITVTQLDV